MFIMKKSKKYEICEYAKYWTVSTTENELKISFNVDKKICHSTEELIEYIKINDMF